MYPTYYQALSQRFYCLSAEFGGSVHQPIGVFHVLSFSGNTYCITFRILEEEGAAAAGSSSSSAAAVAGGGGGGGHGRTNIQGKCNCVDR